MNFVDSGVYKNGSVFSVATWNINSIRARMETFLNWLNTISPDVILLQEVKCESGSFPMLEINCAGYNVEVVGQKSYNGVAILSKHPIELEMTSLPLYGGDIVDNEARYVEGVVNIYGRAVRVASVYVPNGGSVLHRGQKLEDSDRFKYKLDFLRRLAKRVNEIVKFEDELLILGGDYNVAFAAIDLYNPEQSAGDVGFHEDEIKALNGVVSAGVVDSYRFLYPDKVAYSWWDYRRKDRWLNDKGWRIDYLLASRPTVESMLDCVIHKEVRGVQCASDHVPVEMKVKVLT